MRELLFGKGDDNLFRMFGTEASGGAATEVQQPLAPSGTAQGIPQETRREQQSLWFEDTSGDRPVVATAESGGQADDALKKKGKKKDGPAWVDEDDSNLKVRCGVGPQGIEHAWQA